MTSPPPPTLPSVILDRYLWLAVGVFAAYAAYTTQSQLKTFKARCVSKPQNPVSSNDAAVDRTTEDGSPSSGTSKRDSPMTEKILTMDSTAIRLETLEALARGINFDLRNAALKIITERATNCTNLDFLRKQIEGRNATARLRALKAMRCLTVTTSTYMELCRKEVFSTLVTCLKNTLPPSEDTATQKEALLVLSRLMAGYYAARELAIEAGIIDWLKMLKNPGYENSVQPVFDPERFDPRDNSLWEIATLIIEDTLNGRKLMIEAGLITATEDDDDDDEGGIEASVEADIIDVATGSAQRAWEGTLEGLLDVNNLPSELHWTEG